MYFLFDIGGTKMRFTVTKDCVECTEPVVVNTPESYAESLHEIERIKNELVGDTDITAAVGGIAGAFNKNRSTLLLSPNNPSWSGKHVRDDIANRLGVETHVDNDTAVIALGEAAYGAGKSADPKTGIVGYLTVSTGVGGARAIGRMPDHKARSFEPGHQLLYIPHKEDDLSKLEKYTFENRVSGTAMEKRFGKKAYEIDDPEVWRLVTKELSVGIYNTLLHWSPDVLVLGGSMITGDPCIPFNDLCENVHVLAPSLFSTCSLVQAELGDLNGVYGAMAWAEQLYKPTS